MIRGFFKGLNGKGVSPVIAIVLLLMMTVAAAGAAYFWLTQMQSGIQERSTKSIENIMQKSGRRLIAQAAICEPTAPDGMVGWWEFYEGKGNKTHDSSENENTGTLKNGPTWVEGKAGKALEFRYNEDDRVEVNSSESLNFSNSFTISAWARLENLTTGENRMVIERGVWSTGWGIYYNGLWVFRVHNEAGDNFYVETSGYSDTAWHYLVGIYNATASEIYFYIDGSYIGKDTTSGNVESTVVDLFIGDQRKIWRDYDFYGTIDEPRIYDRALSAEEINETYQGKMKVRVTVRNVGSVEVPEAKFVANLKKDETTVDSDTYTTTSSIDTDELKTLTFYFNEMRPGGEYNINIPGIDVSQSVSCQSLES